MGNVSECLLNIGGVDDECLFLERSGVEGSGVEGSGVEKKFGVVKQCKDGYLDEFEWVWKVYLKCNGGNFKCSVYYVWVVCVKVGVDLEVIIVGVEWYVWWVDVIGKINIEFVKWVVVFFGFDEYYLEDWLLLNGGGGGVLG